MAMARRMQAACDAPRRKGASQAPFARHAAIAHRKAKKALAKILGLLV
jgi:hypothetical protein